MPELQHPETGGHILVSDPETAEALLAEGWEEIVDGSIAAAEAPAPEPKPKPKVDEPKTDDNGGEGDSEPPEIPSPEKPLTGMKLGELIEHAAKIGMTEEQIAPLRKPGVSKAKAIDAINAYVAAKTAE